jgi:hypothetical protein
MKYTLLIVLLLSLVITGIIFSNKVILIQIIIPRELVPYYEWLVSFPGLEPIPALPAPENVPIFDTKEL